MDQLNIGVTVDANAAIAGLTGTATAIDKVDASTKRMTVSNADAARMIASTEIQSRRFMAALQEEVATYGKSRDALLAYRAAQLGVSDQAKAMIDQLKQVNGNNLKDAGKGMDEFGLKTVGARRELLVLAHELSQGNFKRAAGSVMVLGERMDAMGAICSTAGLAVGGVVAVIGSFAVAAAKGSMETIELRNSMKMTGDYAGITAAQFDTLASKISYISGGTIGGARDALQALVATGRFSGQALDSLGVSVIQTERLTGQSAEEIAKDFAKMSDGVAKWVAQHNESMHFATLAQYEYIQKLEDSGQKEKAYIEVAKLWNAQSQEDVKTLGSLQRGWRSLGSEISSVWNSMKSIGRDDPTEKMNDRIAWLKSRTTPFEGLNGQVEKGTPAQQAELNSLLAVKAASESAKKLKSENAAADEKAIQAHDRIRDKWIELSGSINRADKEIQAFRRDYQTALARDPNDADAMDAKNNAGKIETAIRKKYDRTDFKAESKLDSAYTSYMQSAGAENVKLQDEIAQWELYGKAVDKSRLAVVNFRIAEGDLKGSSPARMKAERGVAISSDTLDEYLSDIKSTKAIEEKIAALNAEANAQGLAKEATKESLLMKELDNEKSHKSADEYNRLAIGIHNAAMAMEARDAANAIKMMDDGTADRIKQIKEESELIGKNVLERQKLAEELKITKKASEDKRAFPDQAAAIDASAAKQIQDIDKALEESSKNMFSWDRGAQSAMKNYVDNARDTASQSQKLFSDAFNGMEDALVNFLEHGKMSFKSLFTSIENDLAHMAAKSLLSSLIGGGSGGSAGEAGLLGSLLGGGSAGGGGLVLGEMQGLSAMSGLAGLGASSSWFGSLIMGGAFADGGDPPVGIPSLVGERGPELFVPKVPGTVVPNGVFNGNSGISIQHSVVVNIDSRTDQAQIHQLVSKSVAQGNADLVDKLQRSGKI